MAAGEPQPSTDVSDGADASGPPLGSAWTLVVAGDEGWSADLEHAAPLPRMGEHVEFIGEDGRRSHFRVIDVVHTLQTTATARPPVRQEHSGPNSIVTDGTEDGPPRALRAGLPRVVVTPAE